MVVNDSAAEVSNHVLKMLKFEDVLGPDTGNRGEVKYNVTAAKRQKHIY